MSRKFGCSPAMAVDLLCKARRLGLDPYGVSFHVGSQQTDLGQWDGAIGAAPDVQSACRGRHKLAHGQYRRRLPGAISRRIGPIERYAQSVTAALTEHFGNRLPEIIVEPGPLAGRRRRG